MAIALDGSPGVSTSGGGTSATVTLTTTNSTDVIILFTEFNGASLHVNNVTDNSGVTATWLVRKALINSAGNSLEEWYTTSTGTMSAKTITINYSGTTTFTSQCVVAISGANTSSPFDTHAGIPVSSNADPPNVDPLSISTTNANDFIVGAFRMNSTASPTAGAGWTPDKGANFLLVEHQIVSAAQTNLSVNITTGLDDANGGIADAIVASAGAANETMMPMISM